MIKYEMQGIVFNGEYTVRFKKAKEDETPHFFEFGTFENKDPYIEVTIGDHRPRLHYFSGSNHKLIYLKKLKVTGDSRTIHIKNNKLADLAIVSTSIDTWVATDELLGSITFQSKLNKGLLVIDKDIKL